MHITTGINLKNIILRSIYQAQTIIHYMFSYSETQEQTTLIYGDRIQTVVADKMRGGLEMRWWNFMGY